MKFKWRLIKRRARIRGYCIKDSTEEFDTIEQAKSNGKPHLISGTQLDIVEAGTARPIYETLYPDSFYEMIDTYDVPVDFHCPN